MIIYFTGSVSKKDLMRSNYLKIVQYLIKLGHTVIAEHILDANTDAIRKASAIERVAFQHKVEHWIEDCHCVIAETSYPAVSVGYEIGMALQMGKPTLILHDAKSDPPSLFAQHHDENIVTAAYTKDNFTDIVRDFLAYVDHNKDVKFTFFISSKHARYLEKISKNQKIPKSAYLRGLIENDIHRSRK